MDWVCLLPLPAVRYGIRRPGIRCLLKIRWHRAQLMPEICGGDNPLGGLAAGSGSPGRNPRASGGESRIRVKYRDEYPLMEILE